MTPMNIHILRCGTVRLPQGGGLLVRRVTLPVWCYLIDHPTQGLLLADTGVGTLPLPPQTERHFRPEPGPLIGDQLERLGLRPRELDAVILSDFDADHAGGVRALREAKRFLVSEEEYYWTARSTFSRYQPRSLWENDVRFEAYYLRAASWAPAQHALDLFGDGSVISVLTHGHTFGNCTLLLRWNGKSLLLAGSTVRCGRTLEDDRVYHRWRQDNSVRWLRSAAAEEGCLGVLATHDPGERERVIVL